MRDQSSIYSILEAAAFSHIDCAHENVTLFSPAFPPFTILLLEPLTMTSLGFWEATWPLRRFMTLTHQFLPLPTLWKRLFWFFTNASFVLITLLALVQLVVETYAKSITVLETTVVFLAIAETCFRLVYLNWNQRDIFHLMTRCERFPGLV